jgi:predicted MPP superfamily phosphohydrolase
VTIADKIQIIGRDDRSNHKRKPLESLIAQTHDTIPTLLLDHQPYNLKQADSLGIDIQCYGHTHNGQMWPLNLLIKNMYEQGYGYRKWENSHIFVSSGLSLWGPKFRIGTQSEIIVIDLI